MKAVLLQLEEQINFNKGAQRNVLNDPYPCGDTNSSLSFVSIGTTVKVHVVDLENETVAPHVNVRPLLSSTVRDLCNLIHEVRNCFSY